jgi:hypothetical protein
MKILYVALVWQKKLCIKFELGYTLENLYSKHLVTLTAGLPDDTFVNQKFQFV